MTDHEHLTALAERCEAATGPDRELEGEIYRAVEEPGWDNPQPSEEVKASYCRGVAGVYTASIDAAMTLVPKGLEWTLDCLDAARDPRFGKCQARIMLMAYADDPKELGPQAIANGDTPALALCAAALRARAEEQQP